MLNFSPEKLLFVMMIALVVLGPQRLPGAARSLGKMIGQLRQLSGSLQNEVNSALAEPKSALMGTVKDLGLGELRDSVRSMNPLTPLSTPPSRPSTTASSGTPVLSGGVGMPPASVTGSSDLPPPPDDPSLN